MKVLRSGGQEHGIKMGWPFGPSIPSQLPVPLGFTPAVTPNSGTREASTRPGVVDATGGGVLVDVATAGGGAAGGAVLGTAGGAAGGATEVVALGELE